MANCTPRSQVHAIDSYDVPINASTHTETLTSAQRHRSPQETPRALPVGGAVGIAHLLSSIAIAGLFTNSGQYHTAILVVATSIFRVIRTALDRGIGGIITTTIEWYLLLAFFARGARVLQLGDTRYESYAQTLRSAGYFSLAVQFASIAVILAANHQSQHTARPPTATAISSVGSHVQVLCGLFSALLALRLASGLLFNVGIPGRIPRTIPFAGLVFSVGTYGPLAILAVITANTLVIKKWLPFTLVILYGTVGAALGWRSYIATSAYVVLAVLNQSGSLPRLSARSLFGVAAFILVLTAAISIRAGNRSNPMASVQFLSERLGGVDYAAPSNEVILRRGGPDHKFLSEAEYSRFLKVDVFGLPPTAITAFAGTAIGYSFAFGGLLGLVLTGFAVGLAAALANYLVGRPEPWFKSIGVGLGISTVNFCLEGTAQVAFRTMVIFACFSVFFRRMTPRKQA